jgi:hypothetical protein
MNEMDAGRDCATSASVRHDDDKSLTHISPCYCTAGSPDFLRRRDYSNKTSEGCERGRFCSLFGCLNP